MKKKLLSLSLAIFTAVGLNAQVNISYGSPATNGATTQLRAPNGLVDHTTFRGHIIIPAAEVVGLTTGDIITTIGFAVADGGLGTADGNIEFYLENTADVTNLKSDVWATAIGTMTSVYNGAFALPNTAGPSNVEVPTNGTFTYTGGGLYVAYDYEAINVGTFPVTYASNNSLPGSIKMEATAALPAATVLTATSSFRPEIRLGVANPNSNDITVNAVRPVFGSVNRTFANASDAFAYITNTSNTALSNVDVTLNVTGANSFTGTQTVASIPAGASDVVVFSGIPTTADGTNTYTATVANDDDNTNNSATADQAVSCGLHGYAPQGAITSGLGYNQGSGILAIALDIPISTLEATVKKVVPTISNDAAATGNSIKGVLLNTAGTIIDSTASYTIAAGDLGSQVELSFLNGTVDYAGQSLYIGFRQTANTATGYFPLATSDEFAVFPNTYFTIGVNGGAPGPQTGFGAFLIDAELAFGVGVSQSGVTLTATTAAAGMTYQWVDCATNAPVSGETGSIFTASNDIVSTSYRVDATLDGCVGSSPCTFISFVGVEESENNVLSVFPNPATNVLNISTSIANAKSYTVYDLEGRVVLRSNLVDGSELTQIGIDHLEAGTYLIEVVADQNSARKLFVKQ